MQYPTISLTTDDYAIAVDVASSRLLESLRQGRIDSVYEKDWIRAFQAHLLGASGEVALAKYLNVYPNFYVNQFSGMQPDIHCGEHKVEVRHRKSLSWDLVVRDTDPTDRVFVLTRGVPPQIEICGYTFGDTHRKDQYWKNHGGYRWSWFIPASDLFHISKLTKGNDIVQ